jgi:hypothetical protein
MDDRNVNSADNADWQRTWDRHVQEVDNKLVEFFRNAGDKAQDMRTQAKAHIQDWFDHTDMDEKARANWEKAKSDTKLFGAQVENRITHLVQDGKIKWAEWTKKDSAS